MFLKGGGMRKAGKTFGNGRRAEGPSRTDFHFRMGHRLGPCMRGPSGGLSPSKSAKLKPELNDSEMLVFEGMKNWKWDEETILGVLQLRRELFKKSGNVFPEGFVFRNSASLREVTEDHTINIVLGEHSINVGIVLSSEFSNLADITPFVDAVSTHLGIGVLAKKERVDENKSRWQMSAMKQNVNKTRIDHEFVGDGC